MDSTSAKSVLEAYYRQFRKDFLMFLKCRAEELVSGGRMVLTILGRTSEDTFHNEYGYVWEFFNSALNSMVIEVKYHYSHLNGETLVYIFFNIYYFALWIHCRELWRRKK